MCALMRSMQVLPLLSQTSRHAPQGFPLAQRGIRCRH
jgi:hypothetical protein